MQITEMRIVVDENGFGVLQYRLRIPQVDASGAVCGFGEWSEWLVPYEIDKDELDREDEDSENDN